MRSPCSALSMFFLPRSPPCPSAIFFKRDEGSRECDKWNGRQIRREKRRLEQRRYRDRECYKFRVIFLATETKVRMEEIMG